MKIICQGEFSKDANSKFHKNYKLIEEKKNQIQNKIDIYEKIYILQ